MAQQKGIPQRFRDKCSKCGTIIEDDTDNFSDYSVTCGDGHIGMICPTCALRCDIVTDKLAAGTRYYEDEAEFEEALQEDYEDEDETP